MSSGILPLGKIVFGWTLDYCGGERKPVLSLVHVKETWRHNTNAMLCRYKIEFIQENLKSRGMVEHTQFWNSFVLWFRLSSRVYNWHSSGGSGCQMKYSIEFETSNIFTISMSQILQRHTKTLIYPKFKFNYFYLLNLVTLDIDSLWYKHW